jgi:hypothetical protein
MYFSTGELLSFIRLGEKSRARQSGFHFADHVE